jgi:hypothetical protein
MTKHKGLARAWYNWQHTALPVSNFRQGRVNAPTYKIEHDLDHLNSYLYGLGIEAISGKEIDYSKLVTQEITLLENIGKELEECEISASEKTIYSSYIAVTYALLQVMSKIPSNSTNTQK